MVEIMRRHGLTPDILVEIAHPWSGMLLINKGITANIDAMWENLRP